MNNQKPNKYTRLRNALLGAAAIASVSAAVAPEAKGGFALPTPGPITLDAGDATATLDAQACSIQAKSGDYRIVIENNLTAVRSNGGELLVTAGNEVSNVTANPLTSTQTQGLKDITASARSGCNTLRSDHGFKPLKPSL